MVRFLAAVVVLGGAILLGGVLNIRHVRQNVAVAQSSIPHSYQQTAPAPAFNTAAPQDVFHQSRASSPTTRDSSRDDAIALTEVVQAAEVKTTAPANRFDRGRLDEEFDGEPVRSSSGAATDADSLPPPDATELSDPFGATEVAQSGPWLTHDESDNGFLAPRQQILRRPTLAAKDETTSSTATAASRTPVPNSRVTLIRTPDHQIRIIPENKLATELQLPLPTGAILITAEEFNLKPSAEPEAGNQLNCSGRVEIQSENFRAQCTKLSVKNSDLVMEGSPEQSCEIYKLSAAVTTDEGAKTDTSEFRLSARQISFNLSLNSIKVSNTVSILPVEPSAAIPTDEAAPVEKLESFLPPVPDAPPVPTTFDPDVKK